MHTDRRTRAPRRAAYGVIGAAGFAALVAQTLLFRDFLATFEGNELSFSVFFCSWLFWAALGAWLGQGRWAVGLARQFEFALLLFLPAFLLQSAWLRHARELARVAPYELFPFAEMLPIAAIGNAPVCFVSGLLFTLACRWVSAHHAIPVARVFVVEAAGSFVGGCMVTVLLGLGVPDPTVAVIAGWTLTLSSLGYRCAIASPWPGVPAAGFLTLLLLSGIPGRWAQSIDLAQWRRALPADAYQGTFATPQCRYTYGSYQGQFQVLAWQSIVETIPDAESASEIAAIHLAQHPTARNILVFGPGAYGICRRLAGLPSVESITWLDLDPAYPRRMLEVLPPPLQQIGKLRIPSTDARRFLRDPPTRYDLIIWSLPDVTSLAVNRYATRECVQLIKAALAPEGVFGTRVRGGANIMGSELVDLGAGMIRTMESVFGHLAMKPGDDTWIFASDADRLSEVPGEVRRRFAGIPGAGEIYPPDALAGRFEPERIAFQWQAYRAAIESDDHGRLLSSDRHPKALFHSLLLAARESGASADLPDGLRAFARAGAPVFPAGLGILFLLRLLYRTLNRRRYGEGASDIALSRFDSGLLVFAAGAVNMVLAILLMFFYQAVHGSLFLAIGLLSASTMIGMAVGGGICERLSVSSRGPPPRLLVQAGGLHAALLILLWFAPPVLPEAGFGLLFFLSGCIGGAYLPLVAARLKAEDVPDHAAGGVLAWSDDLGGALGGVVCGLLLLPVFGASYVIAFLLTLLGLAFGLIAHPRKDGNGDRGIDPIDRWLRPLGYSLFGLCAITLLVSALLSRAMEPDLSGKVERMASAGFPNADIELRTHGLAGGGRFTYRAAGRQGRIIGYSFSTKELASGVEGYGGPITLGVVVDPEGILSDMEVLESNETPAYLARVQDWMEGLRGADLFRRSSPLPVDGVAGATLTSQAIRRTLDAAGETFAAEVLRLPGIIAASPRRPTLPDIRLLAIVVLAAVAVALRRRPARRTRRIFLIGVAACCGLWLNLQYSMAQVVALIGLHIPPAGLTVAFVMVALVPLLVFLVGNIYCGYLCPFGAIQELLGELRTGRFDARPDDRAWRYARIVKYGLLTVFVVGFALSRNPEIAVADPLVRVFGGEVSSGAAVVVTAVLTLGLFYPRFWCRALCPTGAFLSLLNGVQLLRRFLPPVTHKFCTYGVTGKYQLDCLTCDRCRRVTASERPALALPSPATGRRRNRRYAAAVLVGALFIVHATMAVWMHPVESRATSAERSARGQPRDADHERLRWMIEQGRLSDREAMHYRKSASGQPTP
jgi:hypothetical protein